MKKILFIVLLFAIAACEKSNFNNNNPYIPNYSFSIVINMDLPEYSNLKFPSNGKLILNGGAKGVIVFNTGSGYVAYDAACPNQAFTACPAMTVSGINAICSCDNAKYNLFTGQAPGLQYPMKPYQAESNGNSIRVFN